MILKQLKMNIENDLSGYINVFMVNNINYLELNIIANEENIVNTTDNGDENSIVEENDIVLEENDAIVVEENNVDSEDEETIIENFDENQLIEYNDDDDDETIPYDGEEEEKEDDDTIPDIRHITDAMKDSYCRFYVQHIYCYLKSWKTPKFDDVCQNEYGGDFERCVMDYMMPFVFDNGSFNNWLFDFAYRFHDSLNYLVHYLQEMERIDLINMLHEAIPPNR